MLPHILTTWGQHFVHYPVQIVINIKVFKKSETEAEQTHTILWTNSSLTVYQMLKLHEPLPSQPVYGSCFTGGLNLFPVQTFFGII